MFKWISNLSPFLVNISYWWCVASWPSRGRRDKPRANYFHFESIECRFQIILNDVIINAFQFHYALNGSQFPEPVTSPRRRWRIGRISPVTTNLLSCYSCRSSSSFLVIIATLLIKRLREFWYRWIVCVSDQSRWWDRVLGDISQKSFIATGLMVVQLLNLKVSIRRPRT